MNYGDMIVKVQVSLNNEGKRTLIYNQKKDFLMELDTTPLILKFLGTDKKAFFLARVGNNNVAILKRVTWRSW